jgi:hypothetical protein
MVTIAPFNIMNETSLLANELWKPLDSSATQKFDRVKMVKVARARPQRQAWKSLFW